MPKQVDECVKSVLADNPEYDESRAWAICNAQFNADPGDLTDEQETIVTALADLHRAGVVGTPTEADGAAQTDADGEGMTPRQKSTAATGFDIVGPSPQLPTEEKADDFDPADPPEEFADAIEADDFVIYGKASIEQHDIEGQRISVAALEDALDRFFDSEDAPGIISRGHADVPVGRPVREHTLDDAATLVIDGEQYDFDAGDSLRTEPKDADGDDRPELWLASRLANDSDIARETRYKALTGDLNGYSVTVKPKPGARRQTDDGEDILAVDLHAVTVGSDEAIRNKGSEFDVAEFKALFHSGDATLADLPQTDDAIDQLAEALGRELHDIIT